MSGKGGEGGVSLKNGGSESYISYTGYIRYIGYTRWMGDGRGGGCPGREGCGRVRRPGRRQGTWVVEVTFTSCTSCFISMGCAGVESEPAGKGRRQHAECRKAGQSHPKPTQSHIKAIC